MGDENLNGWIIFQILLDLGGAKFLFEICGRYMRDSEGMFRAIQHECIMQDSEKDVEDQCQTQ